MSLAIIILNWNNAPDTISTALGIQAWRRVKPTIWIVDNGSSDDSVERLREQCPDVRLLLADHNLGFAAGNNLAIHPALESGATQLLLLNNDAVISEDDVAQLMATLETAPRAGVVGSLLRDPPPSRRLQAAGGRGVAWRIVTHQQAVPEGSAPYPVEYVPGTAILISAEVLRNVGLLDERYFISGEIADLCRRAQNEGFVCLIDPTTTTYHDTGRSSELREAFYAYYFLRNRFLYVRKFYSFSAGPLILYWAAFGLTALAKALVQGRRARARALALALRHGLAGTFGDQSALILERASRP